MDDCGLDIGKIKFKIIIIHPIKLYDRGRWKCLSPSQKKNLEYMPSLFPGTLPWLPGGCGCGLRSEVGNIFV